MGKERIYTGIPQDAMQAFWRVVGSPGDGTFIVRTYDDILGDSYIEVGKEGRCTEIVTDFYNRSSCKYGYRPILRFVLERHIFSDPTYRVDYNAATIGTEWRDFLPTGDTMSSRQRVTSCLGSRIPWPFAEALDYYLRFVGAKLESVTPLNCDDD